MSFCVAIDVGEQLDEMIARSMNAFIREYTVAGVALLRLLKEQNIPIDADIDLFRSVYEECFCSRAHDLLEFRVDLSQAGRSSPARVSAAYRTLLRVSDTEIDARAYRFVACGLYYSFGVGLVPIHLVEFVDHRFLA